MPWIVSLLVSLGLGQDSGFASEAVLRRYPKPSISEIKSRLTPEQFDVTQKAGTERPFKNPYWDHHEPGIYVDVVTGEPLFSSLDKFDSGTGWPSFSRPISKQSVVEKADRDLLLGTRTEVRSRSGDSHLGHVFGDGPEPTGLRYCINSAALRFVPASELASKGYAELLPAFAGLAVTSAPSPGAGSKR